MSMSIITQMEEAGVVERGVRALEKAKRLEHKRIAKGARYIHINERTKVLVDCDKDGQPTEKGRQQLAAYGKIV